MVKKKYVERLSEASVNQPVYTLSDQSGNVVGTTNYLPENMAQGQTVVYRNDAGQLMAEPDTTSSVALDKKTGKITVSAPSMALQNPTFKSVLTEELKNISSAYKSNSNFKYSTVDEKGENVSKGIDDIINDLNAPAKNEDGTINSSSIAAMVNSAMAMERTKDSHKRANQVELDDNDAIRINTVAAGPDVKDNTLQLISNLPEAKFLRDIGTYNTQTGTAQYKDIMDNAWNREKTSFEDMVKLIAALENYFEKGDFSDKEEYIRNTATMRFIEENQANMSWIRDVKDNVKGFLDGIFNYGANIGTSAVVGLEQIAGSVFGITDDYLEIYGTDYSGTSIARGGSQYDTSLPREKVDMKIGKVVFDVNGVPTYQEEKIEGGFDKPRTLGQYLRNVYKENDATIKKDLAYIHESQLGWSAVGYAAINLAALVDAGNVASGLFRIGTGAIAGKVAASLSSSLADTATTLYASGTALNYGTTAAEAASIVRGMGVIYDVASATGQAGTLLNFIGKGFATASSNELLFGVVGESIAEAVVGDPDRFVEVLASNEINEDTKNYLIETYIGNALGWGVGLGVGKFLIGAGETTTGRAISANMRRHIFSIQNKVGDAFDRTLLTIRRIDGDEMADKIKTLWEKGGRSAKQADSLAATQLIREARKAIIDAGPIEIAGKSTDEIQEALAELDARVLELQGMEIALNSMQRQGMDIAAGWLKDNGSEIGATAKNFYKQASKVTDLEKSAGVIFRSAKGVVSDVTTGSPIKLFSQTTTNYIKATEKIDFINAYLKKYENVEDVTDTILKNIESYKKELPELTEMVKKFTNNATPELKQAADNFITADRKWWNSFETMRGELGLTSQAELDGFRASGLWGKDGAMYARTSRKADLSEYVIKHRDGSSNVKTYDVYEQYMAGATGDFVDPMGEMQIALYDAANKQAYRSFAKNYNSLTGSMTLKVSGRETELSQRMEKGLKKSYYESSKEFLNTIAENVGSSDGIKNVINNLELKGQQLADINKTKKSINSTAKKMDIQLGLVDSNNAGYYMRYLNAEDTIDLWNNFYGATVEEMLADGGEYVPSTTKRFIRAQANQLALNLPEDASTLDAYNAVKTALRGTTDTPDMYFENRVKRSIMSKNENIINDTRVQQYLTEQRQIRYENTLRTMLADRTREYEQLAEEYGTTVEALNVASREQLESYVNQMTREGTGSRAAIDELCKFYGLEGDEAAIRYFALSAFVDNEAKYKKDLFEKLLEQVKADYKSMPGNKQEKVAGVLTNGIAEGMKEEFNNAYLIVKESNPDAVHDTTEKLMRDVNRIRKDIEGAEANRYAGQKNIIALRNYYGQVEYYETDPLLAGLMNFHHAGRQMNGLSQALYNTNYLWSKLFRLGTTSINVKSMISQSFRDPINMFIGGGAYRTTQNVANDLRDVFGNDIVAYLRRFEPDALMKLEKTAAETGESVAELAVKREIEIGRAISPAATETSMYRSLNTARKARIGGVEDIYDVSKFDKVTSGIDAVAEKAGSLNEFREKTLRNVSYANAFGTAMKRGYSVAQARTYATFIMNEATTNFTRMTNHLQALRDTVPYLGSAINGSKSFYRLLSMDPVGVVGRLVGGLIIPSTALAVYSLNDEENREVYKNIPEYEKENSIIFVVNGQVMSVPIPQEMGSFIAPFRQTVESMAGVSTNTFQQLAWNNILGFSPLELRGFADLDFAKLETSNPGFFDRIGRGTSRLWSQIAPAPLKSGLEVVTGVDPYTGRKIDTSYLDYDEDGNPIVKDYQSGVIAKGLNSVLNSWGLKTSAPVLQNVLSNIFGQASVDVLDFLTSLFEAIPEGGLQWSMDTEALEKNQAYNPLYTLTQRVKAPISVDVYDEAQSAWKTEVTKLYNMKSEILRSDAWQKYLEAKRNADDSEKLKNIDASKKNLVENYFKAVKSSVENLQKNYGEQFTAAKYATVLSLLTMEEQTLDAGSYGNYLNTEMYKAARAQAIQTMMRLGYQSAETADVLGKYVVNNNGEITVKTYHPLAILQLDDMSGAALSTQSNKQHYAVIRNLLNDGGAYGMREKYYSDVDSAYDEKDYDRVEQLMNDYNEKIIRIVAPYIGQYGAESVLQGDVMDYLEDYIMVPSSFMGEGKYYSSKTGLNKQQGYARNYIKAIFNYGKNRL